MKISWPWEKSKRRYKFKLYRRVNQNDCSSGRVGTVANPAATGALEMASGTVISRAFMAAEVNGPADGHAGSFAWHSGNDRPGADPPRGIRRPCRSQKRGPRDLPLGISDRERSPGP